MDRTIAEYGRLAKVGYERYCAHANWKSLVTGDDLPPFDELSSNIQRAWLHATRAILKVEEKMDKKKYSVSIVLDAYETTVEADSSERAEEIALHRMLKGGASEILLDGAFMSIVYEL